MIRDVHPGYGSWLPNPDPGVKKAPYPGSRIWIRDTGFTVLVLHKNYICFLAKTKRVFCFGQGVVYLSEIQTVEDLKELSAKQAKEILAMNR
jgi:hypothetical protein